MATQVLTEVETKVNEESEENPSENVMGVGEGKGNDSEDVTYSTKPNNKIPSEGGVRVGDGIFTTINTQVDPKLLNQSGSIMGVGSGIGDEAGDV